LRVKTDGTQIHKVHLREQDRIEAEPKLRGLSLVYKKLTNKILTFEFVKTTLEERKKHKKDREARKDAPKAAEKKDE
jgi:hypothetical protein